MKAEIGRAPGAGARPASSVSKRVEWTADADAGLFRGVEVRLRYDVHDITWSDDGLAYTVDANTFWTVRPGWFFMRIDAGDESWRIHRDLEIFRSRKVIVDKTAFESFREIQDRTVEIRRRNKSEAAQQAESTVPPEDAPSAPSGVR